MRQGPTTAVLLAAGRGKRQRPYTDTTPKPLLPVNGRPTLDYVLTSAGQAGIQSVCLVTHHLGEQIDEYVGDGSAWGLTAVTCDQPELLGTALALQMAVSAFPEMFSKERPFLLTATDYVFPPDYLPDLVATYQNDGADMAISLKELPSEQILRSSTVWFQENGRITRIIEKPAPDDITSPYSASLTFVLPSAIVDYLGHMKPSPRGEFEIQNLLNQMLSDGYTANGCVQETPREWEAPGLS
jgi:NDP-sugar pyrophosphorylase family protein